MSKRKKSKKSSSSNEEVWTEELYEEYFQQIYCMDFIAGFTEGGVPYGILEDKENYKIGSRDIMDNDDLPF